MVLRSIPYLSATLLLLGCSGADPLFGDAGADFQQLPDSLSCLSNNDGVITMDELVFRAGVSVNYRVNPPGTLDSVDVDGTLEDGRRRWDHSSLKGQVAAVKVEPVAGAWFAKHFPDASFATGTDVKAGNLQVIRVDRSAGRVQLLGLASRQPDRTLMVYSPPIQLLRFPLRVGLGYSSSGEVQNGKLGGLPIATSDTYQVQVDQQGTVVLPNLELRRSLRIKVRVTSRAVGGVVGVLVQHQWFHECMGEVVRTTSRLRTDGKPPDTGKATEYRRLSL